MYHPEYRIAESLVPGLKITFKRRHAVKSRDIKGKNHCPATATRNQREADNRNNLSAKALFSIIY